MARVTGIGGSFFRARDPDRLNRWYGDHLGVVMLDSHAYQDPGWFQDRGETVFAAFPADSDAFGGADKMKVTTFLGDRRHAAVNTAVRNEVLGDHRPALTVVAAGIWDPAWLVEIEAIAAA